MYQMVKVSNEKFLTCLEYVQFFNLIFLAFVLH